MTDSDGDGDGGGLVTVRIVGLPMPVYLQASEHGDELMREFALIAAGSGAAGSGAAGSGTAGSRAAGSGASTSGAAASAATAVPVRLTALVEELRARFSGFTLRPESELAEAAARGETAIDLDYVVPRDAARAVTELGALLDEADEFCRAGDLLTLTTPPEAVAFRRWFLDEFVRQADGEAPTPWADWKP